jgi:hypothetical protein
LRVAKGTTRRLKVFAPAVLLEVGRPGATWTGEGLEGLEAAAQAAAGTEWQQFGPVQCRPGNCILRFDAPHDRKVPSASALLDRLKIHAALDEADVSVPGDLSLLWELTDVPGAVDLRLFAQLGPEQVIIDQLRLWVNDVFARTTTELGEPTHIAFGKYGASSVGSWQEAADVVIDIGARSRTICLAVWPECDGIVTLAGSVGARGLQVARIGAEILQSASAHAEALAELGTSLALTSEPVFGRVTLDATGSDIFAPYTRMQRFPQTVVPANYTESNLDKGVPDAYWWQLVAPSLLEGLEAGSIKAVPLTGAVSSIKFGHSDDWIPDALPGELPGVPKKTLEPARAALRPLLTFY